MPEIFVRPTLSGLALQYNSTSKSSRQRRPQFNTRMKACANEKLKEEN